jgi:hypothetical protein
MFPEIEKFTAELRAHYRAVGLCDAHQQADNYAKSIEGMYRATIGNPPGAEHFEHVLAIHRRGDLSFEEKRRQLSAAFKNTDSVQH